MSALLTVGVFVGSGLLLALAERSVPARAQRLVRPDSGVDLVHVVLSNAAPSAVLGALAAVLVGFTGPGPLAAAPWPLAWLAVLAVTELTFYGVHRALHEVPWLWRVHALHHAPTELDWLAGFRKHVLEALLHGAAALPLLVLLGPTPAVLLAHTLFGVVMTGFTHWNVRWRLAWLEPLLVTPRYHAWHHADEPEARGRNLAGKLTALDRLFGTRHVPKDRSSWPARTGPGDDTPGTAARARGWWAQQRAPWTGAP